MARSHHIYSLKLAFTQSAEANKIVRSNEWCELRHSFDEELKAIQRLLVQYFASKATEAADKDWEEKGYDADTFKKEHMRTSHNY